MASQHNGNKNYKEVGIVLLRSLIVLGCLTIPVSFLWYNSYEFFRLLNVEHEVCLVIKSFMRVRMYTIPFDVLSISYEKYLMAIGVVHPSMWSNIFFNLTILGLDTLFVTHFKFGYSSLAVSWVIGIYLSGLLQIALSLRYPEVQRTLQSFSREVFDFQKLKEFFFLGLPVS